MVAADPLELAHRIADRVGTVPGVVAVVLGGSHARGIARPDSDVDLGIFYREAAPPDRATLQALANEFGSGAVTPIGEWGPWINGGAWLDIEGVRVDWLYREIERTASVVEDCRGGRIAADYYLGYAHAFQNYIYLGDIAHCVPLFDPQRVIAALKSLTRRYPPAMRSAIIQKYTFDARFTLEVARKPAARGDLYVVAGCLFRCVASMVQVLYALNEVFFVNEKGSLEEAGAMQRSPATFARRARAILARPGARPAELRETVGRMDALLADVESLAATA